MKFSKSIQRQLVEVQKDFMPEDTEAAVVEMGINHFGEMHRLSEMVKPDICVMTNIGQCHLEFLGSRDGILKAKSEIFDFMNPEGTVCVNGDDDKLMTIGEVHGKRPVHFGLSPENDIYADTIVSRGLLGSTATIHTPDAAFDVQIPLPGAHMVLNALAATAVGLQLGLTTEQIAAGIAAVQAVSGRSRVVQAGDLVLGESEYLYTASELYGGNGHQLQKLLCQLPNLRSVPYNHHDRTSGLRKRCYFQ